MSNFMMSMISWVLLLLVILTLYLIDKVNQLARMYEPPQPVNQTFDNDSLAAHTHPSDLLFAGLEGKRLWDAMNGKQVDGFEANLIQALRPHYEPVLRAHIAAIFKDGMASTGGDEVHVPSSLRKIPTVRGEIQSWLPPQHLGSVYRVAREFAGSYSQNPDPEVLMRLKQTVDSVTNMLYQRVGITNEAPISEVLFEAPAQPEVAPEAVSGSMLALSDESNAPEQLGEGLLESSDVREPTPEELAQGLEHVQAYEDQQRQEIAAATVEAVMHTDAESTEVIEEPRIAHVTVGDKSV